MRQVESAAEFDNRIKDRRPATDEQIQKALERYLPIYMQRMRLAEIGIRQMERNAARSTTIYGN